MDPMLEWDDDLDEPYLARAPEEDDDEDEDDGS